MKYSIPSVLSIATSFLLLVVFNPTLTSAFLSPSLRTASPSSSTTSLYNGNIEQIEFKIYPDGRIEETVRGIKGGECHKVTEEINQSLGKVVESKPTEEMYEQEVVIEQTVDVKNNNGGASSGGWEGASSW